MCTRSIARYVCSRFVWTSFLAFDWSVRPPVFEIILQHYTVYTQYSSLPSDMRVVQWFCRCYSCCFVQFVTALHSKHTVKVTSTIGINRIRIVKSMIWCTTDSLLHFDHKSMSLYIVNVCVAIGHWTTYNYLTHMCILMNSYNKNCTVNSTYNVYNVPWGKKNRVKKRGILTNSPIKSICTGESEIFCE